MMLTWQLKCYCITLVTCINLSSLQAVMPSSDTIITQAPSATPSSRIPSMTTQPLKQPSSPQQPAPPASAVRHVAPPQPIPQTATYFHPGIIVTKGGHWEGADHLLNLTNHIGVYVEVLQPANGGVSNIQEYIQRKVESLFQQFQLVPQTFASPGQPPLPVFQIKLFIYPIERGYVAFCEGRLFESVILSRFKLDPNMAFQAITWQRQSLIVAPTDQIIDQIDRQVEEIVRSFIGTYQVYEHLKKELTR